MDSKRVDSVKWIRKENCFHLWVEMEQNFARGEIKILSECEKCGLRAVERYKFIEGSILDKEGKIVEKFYI